MQIPEIAHELFHNPKDLHIKLVELKDSWEVKIARGPLGNGIEIKAYEERRVKSRKMLIELFQQDMTCLLKEFHWHRGEGGINKMGQCEVVIIAEALKMKNEVKTWELFAQPVEVMQ